MITTIEEFKSFLAKFKEEFETLSSEKEMNQKEIKEYCEDFNKYIELIKKIILDKVLEIKPTMINPKIEELEKKINALNRHYKHKLGLIDYYEGLNFNRLLYTMNNPESLDEFNYCLLVVNSSFNELNIKITIEDYNYTDTVKEYMNVFINDNNSEDYKQKLKDTFEKLYWNNHELLNDIVINVRLLLEKNSKQIKESINNRNKELVKNYNINDSMIDTEYMKVKDTIKTLKEKDKYVIYNNFKNQINDVNNYLDNSQAYIQNRQKLITDEVYEKFSNASIEEFYSNVEELNNNLYEFENYENYKFLIKNIKDIIDKKASINGTLATKDKTIAKLLAEKNKIDQKIKGLEKKKSKLVESKQAKINLLLKDQKQLLKDKLEEIRKEYSDYEVVKFENKVINSVNDSYTILDVLNLYKNNIVNLILAIKNNTKDITKDDINIKTKLFMEFVTSPYIKILNSLDYKTEEQINKIIEDKYNLFNFNIIVPDKIDNEFNILKQSCIDLILYKNVSSSDIPANIIAIMLNFDKNE